MLKVTQLSSFGAVFILHACAVPSFDIKLDLSPEKRWNNVTTYYRDDMLAMVSSWNRTMRTKFEPDIFSQWLQVAKAQVPKDYHAELQGMADDLGLSAPASDLMLTFTLLYEMGSPTMCSGLLAAEADGNVIHGRNMDYQFKYEMPDGSKHDWPDVTFDVIFWRGGKKLMTMVGWPWINGMHTGMRFDGWSFEQNSRLISNDEGENLAAAKKGGVGFMWTVRKAMEKTEHFEDALQQLQDTNFMAPHYFVMAGAGSFEGAVLTIDRGGTLLKGSPALRRLEKEAGIWHLLQTNDDVSKAPLDPRRPVVEFTLAKKAQKDVSSDFVTETLRSLPLLIGKTAFSWLAIPKTGYYLTTVRNASVPSNSPEPSSEGMLEKVARPIRSKWTRRATLGIRP